MNQTKLAAYLGISRQWVHKLTQDGVFFKTPKGDYDPVVCLQNYVNYKVKLETEKLQEAEPDTIAEAELRYKKAQADKIEFELEIKQGQYLPYNQVVKELSGVIANCRAKLLSIPVKAAQPCVGIKDPAEIQGLLKAFIYEALDELASMEFDEDLSSNQTSVSDVAESS